MKKGIETVNNKAADYRELLIGCGSRRVKDRRLPTAEELRTAFIDSTPPTIALKGLEFNNLTTLDINPSHKPDIVHDLNNLPIIYRPLLPRPNENLHRDTESVLQAWRDWQAYRDASIMSDNYFDEIHAYEVLEHIGAQGDHKAFFAQFSEFWRILKPNGLFFATCPSYMSMWAWGDPSHTRVMCSGMLPFLSQYEYARQVGITPMSDFRDIYKANFRTIFCVEDNDVFSFVLQAIK